MIDPDSLAYFEAPKITMTVLEQIDWAEDLQNEFLDLHASYSMFPKYDGHYQVLADNLEHVIDSLWTLHSLEK